MQATICAPEKAGIASRVKQVNFIVDAHDKRLMLDLFLIFVGHAAPLIGTTSAVAGTVSQ